MGSSMSSYTRSVCKMFSKVKKDQFWQIRVLTSNSRRLFLHLRIVRTSPLCNFSNSEAWFLWVPHMSLKRDIFTFGLLACCTIMLSFYLLYSRSLYNNIRYLLVKTQTLLLLLLLLVTIVFFLKTLVLVLVFCLLVVQTKLGSNNKFGKRSMIPQGKLNWDFCFRCVLK